MPNKPPVGNEPVYDEIATGNWGIGQENAAVHGISYGGHSGGGAFNGVYGDPPQSAYENPYSASTGNTYAYPAAPPPTYDEAQPQPTTQSTQPTQPNLEASQPKSNLKFTDKSLRHAFIKKVFLLVTIMLIIIAIMCSIPFYTSGLRDFAENNIPFLVVPICVYFVTAILIACVQPLRRSYPLNLIVLLIFTLSTGCMLMSICASYNIVSVLVCMIATLGVSAAITIFAIQTKWDFTSCIGIAYLLAISLIMFGINAVLFAVIFNWEWPLIIYGWLSSILIIFYMIIDIQLIIGGRRFELSEEEYVLAALMLFLDIVNIFLMLLRIFGRK